jgi:hypothetical protein
MLVQVSTVTNTVIKAAALLSVLIAMAETMAKTVTEATTETWRLAHAPPATARTQGILRLLLRATPVTRRQTGIQRQAPGLGAIATWRPALAPPATTVL